MNSRCVDVAFYWTPEEAAAIVDYLDRLRDTVWELYSEDIIECRTPELDEQCDPRQRHLCFDDEIDRMAGDDKQESTSCNQSGRTSQEPGVMNDKTKLWDALPSIDALSSLSDEDIGEMHNLLRALLHACEELYKDPIRRMGEQRHQELHPPWKRGLSRSSMPNWDDEDF
ncbi:hypothetical protein [Granulosicoccus antarcticus]|uniref:Uncharacterized protein n=1 Tax=Granulosicoccus antarcticus IMCC3135 TaxID=1192854 RepID=A0A2Z2NY07_9GAMM|nr:hypothetical protein [Granulosicoccus antarcticus]ASJ71663.1 hypothetical protein IMCC3135_07795 [Granulosicoccus antarcticus IMCC3135]ASJ72117.1 hypothetical protein IMCC3135_10115 [Granulosicoccus antarcticus IMCC3135]ASJ73513.1 hypothetical protein IMCC3135_17155 [Granulosicoccus antarcticus IMCC3135]ASJ73875.1 hypothetical protein IMCC3135_18980 [Granulosicoccus antarcticus IMCC3135]ASJ74149.1 hypothetical protein IMCC3135_20355 [Granulosicoccus antarcticus IMCC3135]